MHRIFIITCMGMCNIAVCSRPIRPSSIEKENNTSKESYTCKNFDPNINLYPGTQEKKWYPLISQSYKKSIKINKSYKPLLERRKRKRKRRKRLHKFFHKWMIEHLGFCRFSSYLTNTLFLTVYLYWWNRVHSLLD